jgi:carboxymethylenebutenolidase
VALGARESAPFAQWRFVVHDMQRYLVEEMVEHYQEGRITRRDLLRRVALITGSVAVANTLVAGVAPPSVAAAPSARVPAQGGVTVSPTDPDIEAGALELPGDGATIKGYLSRPRNGGPFGAVVVIHENRGLTDHQADVTRRLAKQGFVGLAIDLLSRQGGTSSFADPAQATGALGQQSPEQMVGDLSAGVAYLLGQSYVRPNGIGAMGHCFGGGLTWRLATANPALSAAVPFYGSNPPLDAVPNINAAILAIYAGNDERINAGIPAIEAALLAAGKTFEIVIYPGVNHAFFNDTGGSYDADAARNAWTRTVDWFGRYLAG